MGRRKGRRHRQGIAQRGRAPVLGRGEKSSPGGPEGAGREATKAKLEGCDIVREAGGKTKVQKKVYSNPRKNK